MRYVAALSIVTLAAAASYQPVYSTTAAMKTAIRGIGYPKPHPKKLACTMHYVPATGTEARYSTFKCKATYPRSVRKFSIEAVGNGWLCAGKSLAGCKLLRKGFVSNAAVTTAGSLAGAADLAARGYLSLRGKNYHPDGFCQQDGLTFSCKFTVDSQPVTVTLVFKQAKGGYVISGSES